MGIVLMFIGWTGAAFNQNITAEVEIGNSFSLGAYDDEGRRPQQRRQPELQVGQRRPRGHEERQVSSARWNPSAASIRPASSRLATSPSATASTKISTSTSPAAEGTETSRCRPTSSRWFPGSGSARSCWSSAPSIALVPEQSCAPICAHASGGIMAEKMFQWKTSLPPRSASRQRRFAQTPQIESEDVDRVGGAHRLPVRVMQGIRALPHVQAWLRLLRARQGPHLQNAKGRACPIRPSSTSTRRSTATRSIWPIPAPFYWIVPALMILLGMRRHLPVRPALFARAPRGWRSPAPIPSFDRYRDQIERETAKLE